MAPGPAAPHLVAAGISRGVRGALLQYRDAEFSTSQGHQSHAQDLNAGGRTEQQVYSLGARYNLGAVSLAGLYWRHRNELPNGTSPTAGAWTAGASWKFIPAVRVVAQIGRARDDGRVYASGAAKPRGTDTYLNLGADYEFSRRSAAYARVGRV
ncbi:MAG: hypothetical protein CFE45_40705, partial [Burkholderiales bacterium PBB5]